MTVIASQKMLRAINPATGGLLLELRAESAEEVEAHVQRAGHAGETWSRTPLKERLEPIRRLYQILGEQGEPMAQALSVETGRPLQETWGAEILPTLLGLEFLLKRAAAVLNPIRLPARGAQAFAEPHGVIGLIGTWNYPLFLNLVSLCQALAAGNTVVWKPSELALYSARAIQDLLHAADFPPGVVEIAYGDAATGKALTQADCDLYVFTGGMQTGRAILAELAQTGKPSLMELSGNDAFLVCADAPLELAARSAVWGRLCNGGQSCIAPQRFYVARSVYAPFLAQVKSLLEAIQPGEMTPLRTAAARERCQRLVCDAIEAGARLLHGGEYDPAQPGFYFAPTLLADCHDRMAVMAEDLFGPVLAVCPVDSKEEAVTRANADPMGLGASVWTSDLHKGQAIAARLQVGQVSINETVLDAAHPALPFGGRKASGFGKLRGEAGLEAFVVRKVVAAHSPHGARRHLFPYLPSGVEILRSVARLKTDGWSALPSLIRAGLAWNREEQAIKKSGEKNP